MKTIDTGCCIVGGGPAGMMLGFLLARAGVKTLVLEKHADFLRDFRGDTVHPSTLAIMDELGLYEKFLRLPHQKLQRLGGFFGATRVRLADFSRLPVKGNFIAFMPQWDFLNFLQDQGKAFPSLGVLMQTEFTDLIMDGARCAGVRATDPQGPLEIRAALTIGADGRHSRVREKAGLQVTAIGAPIDVLWFRIGRDAATFDDDFAHVVPGNILITLDRGDYWQCAYAIPKGAAEQTKARGLDAFRSRICEIYPALAAHIQDLKSWDDVKLLSVAVDRLETWSKPGLLCIGDAAHAMSPVGGVGINLAVQDAVAAANLLAQKLVEGRVREADLDLVRRRRLWPAKMIQWIQVQAQNRVLAPALNSRDPVLEVPAPFRLITACPRLQGLTARIVGLGLRPEHVRSPAALSSAQR